MFIAVTFLNVFFYKVQSKKYIRNAPELEIGYKKLFEGILVFFNIPWIIMGIGILLNMTNSVFDYINPKTLNPIVLVFHFILILLWILCLWWIYMKNAAGFLEKHPGLFRISGFNGRNNPSKAQIKFFATLMVLGGLIAMILMWTNSFYFSFKELTLNDFSTHFNSTFNNISDF